MYARSWLRRRVVDREQNARGSRQLDGLFIDCDLRDKFGADFDLILDLRPLWNHKPCVESAASIRGSRRQELTLATT